MNLFFAFIMGVIFGSGVVVIIGLLKQKEADNLFQKLSSKTEEQKSLEIEQILGRIKESLGSLSLDALSKNSQEFLKLAHESLSKQTETGEKNLETKKELINKSVEGIQKELKSVQDMVINFEKDREKKYGELSENLKFTAEQTAKLQDTTQKLKTALVSTNIRGKWGEKIADDILRAIGFIEGVNYLKQKQQDTVNTIPDFTFLLPKNLKVNMDVKFPLNNYLRFLETENEPEKDSLKSQFLKDVKHKIKEVSSKEYINSEEHTLDYVILFIPNEQVYGFMHENDISLFEEALKKRVIICSPFTLYAILAVIRQSVDNFYLEQKASQILAKLGKFYKQWEKFVDSFEKMGKKLDEAQDEFNKVNTTRKKGLERALKEVDDLRQEQGIALEDKSD